MRKKYLIKICLLLSCLGLAACGKENNSISETKEQQSWFSVEELAKVHLENLAEPINCEGKANVYTSWYNDGYSFSKPCPSEDVMKQNAEIYFNYFKENYDGKFGVNRPYGYGTDITYCRIVSNDSITAYEDDNPSPLYKFYYVTDTTLVDGYLKSDAVYSFEIRYEVNSDNIYYLKIFIEKANESHNKAFTYKYNLQ